MLFNFALFNFLLLRIVCYVICISIILLLLISINLIRVICKHVILVIIYFLFKQRERGPIALPMHPTEFHNWPVQESFHEQDARKINNTHAML